MIRRASMLRRLVAQFIGDWRDLRRDVRDLVAEVEARRRIGG